MQNIILKRATAADVETFLTLEQSAAHLKTYSAIIDRQEAEAEIQNNVVYLIEKDGAPVGSLGYQMKDADHAYLSGLVVDPRFQGQGIAREAMACVLEELKGIKRIDLVTHPSNTPAVMLYLSLGFVIESWKDNYFGDGEPRIVLAKTKV